MSDLSDIKECVVGKWFGRHGCATSINQLSLLCSSMLELGDNDNLELLSENFKQNNSLNH